MNINFKDNGANSDDEVMSPEPSGDNKKDLQGNIQMQMIPDTNYLGQGLCPKTSMTLVNPGSLDFGELSSKLEDH